MSSARARRSSRACSPSACPRPRTPRSDASRSRPPRRSSPEPMTAAADTGRYTIAVAAELTGMHPQTLRKYERAGLLVPTRQAGNQRLYSRVDIERLLRIQHLVHETGINIAGLVLVFAMTDRLDA